MAEAIVGQQIPDLTLQNDEDVSVSIRELVKDKPAVFFMYPKANTPGCTAQACGFRDNYATFQAKGYNVFGLDASKPKSLENWKAKKDLPYMLLSDPERELVDFFGAKKGKGITRSHVVVAKGGRVEEVAMKVSPAESVKQAVAFVEAQGADLKRPIDEVTEEKAEEEEEAVEPVKKRARAAPKKVEKKVTAKKPVSKKKKAKAASESEEEEDEES